jgi:hypothetical protein
VDNNKATTRLEYDYAGRMVLDRFLLPPYTYTPRKSLDKKSRAFLAMLTLAFTFSKTRRRQTSRNAAMTSLTTATIQEEEQVPAAVLVTPDLISRIRNVHLLQPLPKPTRQKHASRWKND